jgi:glycerol-3-phosphate dehydrogenase (NAD(P)+)
MPETVTILGAGTWGTALGIHLARIGHDVRLWARDADLVAEMLETRANARYLPGVGLPDRVTPVAKPALALQDAKVVVFAVPSHGLRAVVRAIAPSIPRRPPSASASREISASPRVISAAMAL